MIGSDMKASSLELCQQASQSNSDTTTEREGVLERMENVVEERTGAEVRRETKTVLVCNKFLKNQKSKKSKKSVILMCYW